MKETKHKQESSFPVQQKTNSKIFSKRTFILLMGAFLLAAVSINVYAYLRLQQKAYEYSEKSLVIYSKQPMNIVGLLDSYGVPYSPEVEESFINLMTDAVAAEGCLGSVLDLYGLYVNKTWELNGIFENGVTIGEMKFMQNFGMDFVRHKYGEQIIRKDKTYTCNSEIEDISVAAVYKRLEEPLVLYSCTANDLFYYFNTSLENITPQKVWRIISNYKNALKLLQGELAKNLETLSEYNPNAHILVMGLYLPSNNFFLQRAGSVFIDQINKTIKKECENHLQAEYVDVSCLSFAVLEGDFHPNQEGQKILAAVLVEAINNSNWNEAEDEKGSENTNESAVENKDSGFGVLDKEGTVLFNDSDAIVRNWLQLISTSELPKNDYVEVAVAAEQTLASTELGDMPDSQLLFFIERAIEMTEEKNFQKALEVLRIERKMHAGFTLEEYTLNNILENDKLSLVKYYNIK